MKKEKLLKGGLEALLGGSSTNQEAATTPAPAPTPAPEEMIEGTPAEEDALIATIEDEELKAALHRKRMEKRGRPRKAAIIRSREEAMYKRTTWIMRRDLLAKLKEISFRETLTLKEIIEKISLEVIARYEEKHGEVIPRDHHGDISKLF